MEELETKYGWERRRSARDEGKRAISGQITILFVQSFMQEDGSIY